MAFSKRVYVAGHKGMVGSAILRRLTDQGDVEIISRTHQELDLRDQQAVTSFFAHERIDEVYLAAGKVGGIHANNAYPAEFIYDNLMVQCNVINSAHNADVQKLLFLGSSCIYPRLAQQPMSEDALLSGALESTNEPYAIAKIAGIKLCESYNRQYGRDYRSVMPTNLYGPNDNFHSENSHVIPALMRRIHEAKEQGAKEVVIWGSGRPRREFLHVDDMANAGVYVMNLPLTALEGKVRTMLSHINVGSGVDCMIRELAETLVEVCGFKGDLVFDSTKPDGTPRKLLDIALLRSLGWTPSINLKDGLQDTYAWFLENESKLRL